MLNQIAIMGRLVKDPELRHANETPVCMIRIACDRDYKNANGEKEADFFDVVSWRKLAEIVNQYAAKGRMVSVVGRLQTRTWNDRDGNKRYSTEIVAEHVYFCDPKPKEEGAPNNGAASNSRGYGQAPANSGGYGRSGGYGQPPPRTATAAPRTMVPLRRPATTPDTGAATAPEIPATEERPAMAPPPDTPRTRTDTAPRVRRLPRRRRTLCRISTRTATRSDPIFQTIRNQSGGRGFAPLPRFAAKERTNMSEWKEKAGDFEITGELRFAGKTLVLGFNPNKDTKFPYMTCFREIVGPFNDSVFSDAFASDDYMEIIDVFSGRLRSAVRDMKRLRKKRNVPYSVLTLESCVPDGLKEDLTGKLVILAPSRLAPEFRTSDFQLGFAVGGFGCAPDARGRKVFFKELLSGETSEWGAEDILGVANPEKLPVWAQKKLKQHRK